MFLYKEPNKKISNFKFVLKLIISSVISLGLIKVLMESLFLKILYGKAYMMILATRIGTQIIMLPIQIITIYLLEKAFTPLVKKYLCNEEKIGIDEYLDTFDKFTKDPNLDAMKYLMQKFDNPQDKLKIIHVAGTNGKGSVCEMLSSVLVNANYKVGKFISPHLIKFNDGIYINKVEITNEEVEEIMEELSQHISEYNQTHETPVKWFEAITSLTLIYFAKNNCDFAILETGLGGTTDCTNIVNSLVSIITNVGFDHVDILGNSLEKIAEHKAGIIKPNTDTISVLQETVTEVIRNKCIKENAVLHMVSDENIKNYSYTQELQNFDYKNYKNIEINLKGKVQTYNAAEVLECIDILKEKGYEIPDEAIYTGLKNVIHRARMEKLSDNPLIIFDGGHNESAIMSFKQNIYQYYKDKKKIYIVSNLKTKDYRTNIKLLCEDKDAIFIFTGGNNKHKYVSKEALYNEAKNYLDMNIYKYEFKEALNIAMKAYSDYAIIIVGSFYVYKTACEVIKNDRN